MRKILFGLFLVLAVISCKQDVVQLSLNKPKDVAAGLPELDVIQNSQSYYTVRSYMNGNFGILATFANELADSVVNYNTRIEALETGGVGTMVYPSAGIALSTGSAWGSSITNNSTNWNTAYTDRLKWDGGSTGLTAATGRTSLGATTIGSNLFTLPNPSAITFIRINADNSVTALSAANFKTSLSLTASDVSLGNVTNESKATMFTSPTFTGASITMDVDSILIPNEANGSVQWCVISESGRIYGDYLEEAAKFALDMTLPTPSEMLVRGENGEVPYYITEQKVMYGLKQGKLSEKILGLWSSDEFQRRQIKQLEDRINTLEDRIKALETLIQSK